jgi:hypothetical protein
MPLKEARATEHPNGPEVWAGLLAELAAELRQVEPVAPAGDVPDAELDDGGAAWVSRLGGRAQLGAELERLPLFGMADPSSRSRRQSDVTSRYPQAGGKLRSLLGAVTRIEVHRGGATPRFALMGLLGLIGLFGVLL